MSKSIKGRGAFQALASVYCDRQWIDPFLPFVVTLAQFLRRDPSVWICWVCWVTACPKVRPVWAEILRRVRVQDQELGV